MKKNLIFIILIILSIFIVDNILYNREYKESVEFIQYMQTQGYESEIPKHNSVLGRMEDSYIQGYGVSIQFLLPLFLIIIGCYSFHKKIHSGFFKNVISRKKYSTFINKEILYSWLSVMLIPTLYLIAFLVAMITTNFNFNGQNYNSNTEIYNNFLIVMINLMIVSISCINIGLIFLKKFKNFAVLSIFSYLFIVIYQIFSEIIIGPILSNVFNDNFFANGLTFFSFWRYDSGVTPLKVFIYAMLLFIATTIAVKRIYKNEESLIIYAEK